nr:reverse transcriptase domain, zinc finger, CCHC-type, aspartic peptidase domain protein [Tanacetum cinerariifolium]
MTSSDKKIAITSKPKLPSPSSQLISQNKFITLSPYSSPYSSRPRPTYSALANLPSMSQSLTPYTRSPSTASSSSNITRSSFDKPEFPINPNKQIIKILEPLEEKNLNQGFLSLIEYLYPRNAHFYNNDWQTREYYEMILRESQSIMVDEGQADIKAMSEYYSSLIKKSPSVSTSRTSITDADAIERIQVACSSKEEIQNILNEVRRSPASSEDIV